MPEVQEVKSIIHYFVDEVGVPNLFSGKSRIKIGDDGWLSYFILGKLDIEDGSGSMTVSLVG